MIVVTTPTGRIGRQVLDNILDRADAVRVIARETSRLSPRVRDRAGIVRGSHDDIGVVTEAFAGADCVFWLVLPNPRAVSPESYYLDFTRPACEAIKSQGVKRVVGVSTLGHGYPGNAGLLSAALAMDTLARHATANVMTCCFTAVRGVPNGLGGRKAWERERTGNRISRVRGAAASRSGRQQHSPPPPHHRNDQERANSTDKNSRRAALIGRGLTYLARDNVIRDRSEFWDLSRIT